MTNALETKIMASILDAPGELAHVPPVLIRSAVSRALAELPEAILARTLPEDDDRLDAYTLRDLLEADWALCADGSVWRADEVAADADGCVMPREHWAREAESEAQVGLHMSWGCTRCGAPGVNEWGALCEACIAADEKERP